jgi:hypothetical protein
MDHFDLILKYSAWVFEKDPEQGMRVSDSKKKKVS